MWLPERCDTWEGGVLRVRYDLVRCADVDVIRGRYAYVPARPPVRRTAPPRTATPAPRDG